MQVAVVANPTSGRGKGARLIPKVESLLRSMGIRHTMHISGSPADPERMAREAAERGAETVVALGTWGGRAQNTGRTFRAEWAMVWKFSGGKVVYYRAYEDTAAVAAACRAS